MPNCEEVKVTSTGHGPRVEVEAHQGQAAQLEAESAEQAIRESAERFSLLLNSSAEGIYGMDTDSTCIFLNNAGAEMLVYEPHELIGRPIHDVIHHHRADGTHYPLKECKIAIASRAGSFIRVDGEVFWHKNGSAVPVSYSVNPMIVTGRNKGSVITFSDVTERRRIEEALRASNERTQLAANAGGLGLYTWELASNAVVWHNDIAFDIFGIPNGGIALNAAEFASDFVDPEDAAAYAESMAAALARAQPFHFEARIHRRSDREVRWVEFTGRVQTQQGVPVRVVGTAADITSRKLAEQALRQNEERLRQLANTIPNLAWIANADGWITWYNDRWYAYTGATLSEMEGWGWQSVHDPDILQRVTQRWKASIQTGQPFEMTFPLRGADGIFRPFLTLVAPLRDTNGNVVQWFGTNTDVSPLKKAEAELREADRRKDEFLAMLAHELRNPLAPIRNAAELLLQLNSPDPSIHWASNVIARQVSHMAGLLNDLLDVSRVTHGAIALVKERVDLAMAIANAAEQVRPLLDLKKHRLSLHNCHRGTYVFGSLLRLTQIVANLLDNAAKYSPPQTAISIEVLSSESNVEIIVSDMGTGISAELLSHVFEPFSQAQRNTDRSQGGLGLGLAVVKGLVELHGGKVSVESEGIGKGSRFAVVLPTYHEPQRGNPTTQKKDRLHLINDPLDVLLVDDNVDAAESLAALLQAYGHRTMVVHTGAEAVEATQRMQFHVAVLDIGLPDITGYELARRIQSAVNPAPKLVSLTGYGQPEDRAASLDAGFCRHLVKPVDPQALLEFLGECGAAWQAVPLDGCVQPKPSPGADGLG
jgi:PAS domain S-box-containing protein